MLYCTLPNFAQYIRSNVPFELSANNTQPFNIFFSRMTDQSDSGLPSTEGNVAPSSSENMRMYIYERTDMLLMEWHLFSTNELVSLVALVLKIKESGPFIFHKGGKRSVTSDAHEEFTQIFL